MPQPPRWEQQVEVTLPERGLAEGDTIVVPPDFPHQARNVGDIDAVLLIAFSSADRQVKGE